MNFIYGFSVKREKFFKTKNKKFKVPAYTRGIKYLYIGNWKKTTTTASDAAGCESVVCEDGWWIYVNFHFFIECSLNVHVRCTSFFKSTMTTIIFSFKKTQKKTKQQQRAKFVNWTWKFISSIFFYIEPLQCHFSSSHYEGAHIELESW